MQLTIGLKDNGRELKVHSDLDEAGLRAKLIDAGTEFLEFSQEDDGVVLINTAAIAYVEIRKGKPRAIGFGAS